MSTINRYTDKDLEEFRQSIEKKLESANQQYTALMEQIKDVTENTSGDYTKDLSDFSSTQGEVEMLNMMANRQRTYINDLQAALVRIRNKTYGICIVTGELIDKKRLLAVPTTTKSLQAKAALESQYQMQPSKKEDRLRAEDDEDGDLKETKKAQKKPKVLTKVISKPTINPKKDDLSDLFDDDDDDDNDTGSESFMENLEISEEDLDD